MVFPKASLLGFQVAVFSLCPHVAFPLCVFTFLVSLPLLIRTLSLVGLEHHSVISFNLNYYFKGLISKYSHMGLGGG